ncbi:MAG: hypothetical protein JNL88_00055 [Bacteroidia bacterium]|nr:hypothetical protein [Bacteroidia bacterium]
METESDVYFSRVMKLYREGYPLKSIQAILHKEGLKEELLAEALCKLKLLVYKKRKGRGVAFMVSGGVLLLGGFVMTVFLFHANHSFDVIMYGCTISGTLLMGYGAYEVLQ